MIYINKKQIGKKVFLLNSFFKQRQDQKRQPGFPISRSFFFEKINILTMFKIKSNNKLKNKDLIKNPAGGFLNKRGQGLIEYLVLIALMGVATIGIIRTLNQTVKSRFANAIYALQGRNQKAKTYTMKKTEYQRSDLSNFMSGSASTDNKNKRKGR